LIFRGVRLVGLILAKFSGVLAAPMILLICGIRIFSRDPQKIQLSGLNICSKTDGPKRA